MKAATQAVAVEDKIHELEIPDAFDMVASELVELWDARGDNTEIEALIPLGHRGTEELPLLVAAITERAVFDDYVDVEMHWNCRSRILRVKWILH